MFSIDRDTSYVGVPFDGLTPDVAIVEDIANMGVLGEDSDPLLAAALNAVAGNRGQAQDIFKNNWYKEFSESGASNPSYRRMYIDKLPEANGIKKRLNLNKE